MCLQQQNNQLHGERKRTENDESQNEGFFFFAFVIYSLMFVDFQCIVCNHWKYAGCHHYARLFFKSRVSFVCTMKIVQSETIFYAAASTSYDLCYQ
jgi:hypothetical protein